MIFCEEPIVTCKGTFPCGKCRACRLTKANQKMIVSVYAAHEYKKKGQFLTLTFNDAHRPDGLDHKIFQNFMKRLRKRDSTRGVKFFMAGEYGGDEEGTHREHFHVLFYNHKYDMNDIDAAWCDPKTGESLGFTYDGTLTPASMKYVSGYIDKKGYDPQSGKKPPYGRSSCNIPDGMTGIEIERMCKTGKVHFNGREFGAPEKFRRRYKEQWDKFRDYRDAARIYEHFTNPIKSYSDFKAAIACVKAKMDEHDLKVAANIAEKKKKRLQKTLQRRIM